MNYTYMCAQCLTDYKKTKFEDCPKCKPLPEKYKWTKVYEDNKFRVLERKQLKE